MMVAKRVCRDAVVRVQRVLLRYNDADQSSISCLSSQHRLCVAPTHYVLTDRRLGLEHLVGHDLRTIRLSVLLI